MKGRHNNLSFLESSIGINFSYGQLLKIEESKKSEKSITNALSQMDKHTSALIIPEKQNFPCFDFMLYHKQPELEPVIVFIQTTISTAHQHNQSKGDITKLQQSDGVVIAALDAIFGEKHTCSVESNKLVYRTAEKTRNVYYVYASAKPLNEQVITSVDFSNVIVLSMEHLHKHCNIAFGQFPKDQNSPKVKKVRTSKSTKKK